MLKPEPGSANSLRSDSAAPGPNANFRPLTSLPLLQMHRGGRTLRCAWGPIYVLADGSDLLNGWIHLFFRNLLFLLENRHTLLTFLHYTISQIVDEPLKTISPPHYERAARISAGCSYFLSFCTPPNVNAACGRGKHPDRRRPHNLPWNHITLPQLQLLQSR